jgi:hypothetical protein
VLAILFAMAIIFPVGFYHHSWALWLGFDYIVESLPKYVQPQKGLATKGTKSTNADD